MGLCYRDRIAVPAGNEMENDHHICVWIFHTTMRYDRVLLQNRRSRKVGISSDPRANGAKRRSGRKPGARVTNSARLFTPG